MMAFRRTLLVAALAQGAISVYKNGFSSRAEYKSVVTLERSATSFLTDLLEAPDVREAAHRLCEPADR